MATHWQTLSTPKWLFIAMCSLPWLGASAIAADNAPYAKERSDFIAAEQALHSGKRQLFEQLLSRLKHYPLYPYLQYSAVKPQIGKAHSEGIRQFLEEYSDNPLATRLRAQHLERLADTRQWQAYIDYYSFSEAAGDNCRYQLALYHTGYEQLALDAAQRLWLQPYSQPKACDALFALWFKSGGPTADIAWQRFALALNAQQIQLAQYLERFLPAAERPLAVYWRGLGRNPFYALDHQVPLSGHPYHDTVRLYAARQTARIAPQRLDEVWLRLVESRDIAAASLEAAITDIALVLARNHRDEAVQWFERLDPSRLDDDSADWYLRSLLRQQDWPAIAQLVETRPLSQRRSELWTYWHARTLEQLGDADNSKRLFAVLAKERSYHGFLAADRLHQGYQFNPAPIAFAPQQRQQIESLAAMQRIQEFTALGRHTDARREWYFLLPRLSVEELKLFAALLHEWGWHDRAILTIARSEYWDDLQIRFPLLYKHHVNRAAERHQLDASLLFAMIRQESAYNASALSHAGARGLMQLMPATAHNVAKSLKLPIANNEALYDPEFNITLGSSYISQMLERFNHNTILATAAYNAGPHRVKRWLPETVSMPADVWVETIPFRETRGYVQNVHAYIAIYNFRLGKSPIVISQRMKPVGPEVTAQTQRDETSAMLAHLAAAN